MTDTCIPEEEAIRRIEHVIVEEWIAADRAGDALLSRRIHVQDAARRARSTSSFQIDPKDSWLYAACERDLPIFVPGWEDSTLGNIFAAHVINGDIAQRAHGAQRHRIHDPARAVVSPRISPDASIGFFQIGGGIAGDFPICVVPMLRQDLLMQDIPRWGYFCQISDSTTSYGSYSGAVPNEKITWGKLSADTPKYIIESDASIVAPLIFASVLGE